MFVFWKLVRCEFCNGEGSDKSGCKIKGNLDFKSERKDGEFSN